MNLSPELIVYVDENGVPTGETAPKSEAHNGNTRRHAAFSCYIFNDKGQILVTQRALTKKVWPGVWSNSFCGHPLPGEAYEQAIIRKAKFELGIGVIDIQVILPNYSYVTPPYNGIIENEYCPVYLAIIDGELRSNPEEVANYKWLGWSEFLVESTTDTRDEWSFWCKDQTKRFDAKILAEYTHKK